VISLGAGTWLYPLVSALILNNLDGKLLMTAAISRQDFHVIHYGHETGMVSHKTMPFITLLLIFNKCV